jgi:hypothetical protein
MPDARTLDTRCQMPDARGWYSMAVIISDLVRTLINYLLISIKSNKNKTLSLLLNKAIKIRDTIIVTRDMRIATLSIPRENTLRLYILFY